jgi:2-methylcitrate dehydratase PrpD
MGETINNSTVFIAEKYSKLSYGQITDKAIRMAKECLVDYLGCTYAGYAFESSEIVREFVLGTYARGRCTIIGSREKSNPAGACFANSTTGHGPELDDLHKEGGVHIGVIVIPVALALAEDRCLSGRDFLMALVLGYDVSAKVGRAANPRVQLNKGFHPTSTCGVFGAAATAARLMGLNGDLTAKALGIAGSFASGSLECYSDGSLTKRINPGISASSGVMAADLAAKGYTGPKSILEGKRGFLRAYSGDGCRIEDLGRSEPFEIEGISIKSHACCGLNQAAVDAMLKMRLEKGIHHNSVKSIAVELPKLGYDIVGQPPEIKFHPKNAVDAQFSAPYSVAIACIEGKALLEEYSQTSIQRSDVRDMMEKITVQHSADLDDFGPDVLPARVKIIMRNGAQYVEEVKYARGDPLNPLSWEEVVQKFYGLVPPSMLDENKTMQIVNMVKKLEDVKDIREFSRLLAS